MNLSANKINLIFIELSIFVLLIIANIFITDNAKTGDAGLKTDTEASLPHPKTDFSDIVSQTSSQSAVLSATSEATPSANSIPTPSKQTYLVAIIGDSMAETMGDSIDYFQASIRKKYPKTNFVMYNYGIGSENITEGLARFDKPFDHGTRHYGPLPVLKPDILIVGSYAYNPLVPFDKNEHYLELAELVNKAKQISPQVYMLAEIAPIEKGFGTGPGGVNWPADLANAQVQKIQSQMENVFVIGRALSVPVIDVYHKSQIPGSIYGETKYVGTHDHIHTSLLGQTFTGDVMAESVILK